MVISQRFVAGFTAVAFALALSGCASSGNPQPSVFAYPAKGQTPALAVSPKTVADTRSTLVSVLGAHAGPRPHCCQHRAASQATTRAQLWRTCRPP